MAETSCATMGLTVASLRPHFGTAAATTAGYECGSVGNDVGVTLYIYPTSEEAAASKEIGLRHAKRSGVLGAGAEFSSYGSGNYGLTLTGGTHFFYIDGQLLASQGKLIALAHVIYRALA